MIDCELHGMSDCIYTCSHLIEPLGVSKNSNLKMVEVQFTLNGVSEVEGCLCQNCIGVLEPSSHIFELGTDNGEKAYKMSNKPFCIQCFESVKSNA